MKKNKGKEAPKELCAFKNVSQHGFVLTTSQIMGVGVGDIGFIDKDQFDIINKKFAGHYELLDLADYPEGTYKRGMIIKPRTEDTEVAAIKSKTVNLPIDPEKEVEDNTAIVEKTNAIIQIVEAVKQAFTPTQEAPAETESAPAEPTKPRRGRPRK